MNIKKETVETIEEGIEEYVKQLILIIDEYGGVKGSKMIPIHKATKLIYKAEESRIYIQKNKVVSPIESLGIGYIGYIIDYLEACKYEAVEKFNFVERLVSYFDSGSMEEIKNGKIVLGYIGKRSEGTVTYVVYASVDETMSVLSCTESSGGDPEILAADLRCISNSIRKFSEKLIL